MNPEFLNFTLAILSVATQAVILIMLFSRFFPKLATLFKTQLNFISERGILFAGIVALSGSLLSLFYSEFLKYAPCELCWLQRICLYPLSFMLIVAYFRKDTQINFYGIVISVVGALIAFYNHLLQTGWNPLNLACGVVDGPGISCAKVYVNEFGYMTIPMMSFTAFLFIIVLLLPKQQVLSDSVKNNG